MNKKLIDDATQGMILDVENHEGITFHKFYRTQEDRQTKKVSAYMMYDVDGSPMTFNQFNWEAEQYKGSTRIDYIVNDWGTVQEQCQWSFDPYGYAKMYIEYGFYGFDGGPTRIAHYMYSKSRQDLSIKYEPDNSIEQYCYDIMSGNYRPISCTRMLDNGGIEVLPYNPSTGLWDEPEVAEEEPIVFHKELKTDLIEKFKKALGVEK